MQWNYVRFLPGTATCNYDVIFDHTSFEKNKITKPTPVPSSAGASTFATAKSNNSSN